MGDWVWVLLDTGSRILAVAPPSQNNKELKRRTRKRFFRRRRVWQKKNLLQLWASKQLCLIVRVFRLLEKPEFQFSFPNFYFRRYPYQGLFSKHPDQIAFWTISVSSNLFGERHFKYIISAKVVKFSFRNTLFLILCREALSQITT